jgi:hypothetical protein
VAPVGDQPVVDAAERSPPGEPGNCSAVEPHLGPDGQPMQGTPTRPAGCHGDISDLRHDEPPPMQTFVPVDTITRLNVVWQISSWQSSVIGDSVHIRQPRLQRPARAGRAVR